MEEEFWMRISLNKWKNCRVEIYEGWRQFYLERSKTCKSSCNRIVVNATDGNVYTIRPDGSDGRMLTSDASGHKKYKQVCPLCTIVFTTTFTSTPLKIAFSYSFFSPHGLRRVSILYNYL